MQRLAAKADRDVLALGDFDAVGADRPVGRAGRWRWRTGDRRGRRFRGFDRCGWLGGRRRNRCGAGRCRRRSRPSTACSSMRLPRLASVSAVPASEWPAGKSIAGMLGHLAQTLGHDPFLAGPGGSLATSRSVEKVMPALTPGCEGLAGSVARCSAERSEHEHQVDRGVDEKLLAGDVVGDRGRRPGPGSAACGRRRRWRGRGRSPLPARRSTPDVPTSKTGRRITGIVGHRKRRLEVRIGGDKALIVARAPRGNDCSGCPRCAPGCLRLAR